MAEVKPLKAGSSGVEQMLATDTVPAANLPVMVGDSGSGGTKGAVPAPASGDSAKFLRGDGTWAAGGSGAPTNAQYLTLATDATLSAERVLTPGINLKGTDAGAGGAYTLDVLGGVTSPSQITSDQDDYAPTNWSTSTIARISGDSSVRAITGFSASGLSSGTRRTVINIGSYPIYVPCEHPDSTDANRVTGECDHIIAANGGSIELLLDGDSSRWRVLQNTFSPSAPGLNGMYGQFFTSSVGATITGDWGELGIAGNVDVDAPTSTRFGAWVLYTSTSATGTGSLYFSDNILNPTEFALTHSVCSVLVFINTLSTGTQRYTVQSGFIPSPSSTTLAVNNSIGIRYVDNVNSGKWEGFTRNNSGTESTVDLGTTVAANTAYILTTCIDKAHSEARFYLNGVYAGRVTTNLPTPGTDYGMRTGIFKSVGTTSSAIHVPWMTFYTIKGI